MTDRRDFLITCGAVAVAGMSPVTTLATPGGAGYMAHSTGPDGFKQQIIEHLNARFRFKGVDGLYSTNAELVDVVDWPSGPRLEQFAMEFRAESSFTPPEGLYRVTNPADESFALFIQPISGEPGRFAADFCLIT